MALTRCANDLVRKAGSLLPGHKKEIANLDPLRI
jgi:hypothetical protein